jgi:NAD(P)-dependent dehydrogenase (short-subunit alcohol dehydrogenase family)
MSGDPQLAGLTVVVIGGRSTLPIGRVVGPEDIAALAIHLMTNSAVTGDTYDIDGGQQLVGV